MEQQTDGQQPGGKTTSTPVCLSVTCRCLCPPPVYLSSTCLSLSLFLMSLPPRRLQGAADATGAADAVFYAQLPPVTARFNILRTAQLPQVNVNVASPQTHEDVRVLLCQGG